MQLERAVRSFARVLNNRLHGHDRSSAHVKRHFIKARVQLDFFVARVPDASPKVIPIAGGKRDIFGVQHFGGHGSDKKIAAEEKIAIVPVKFLSLRSEEHTSELQSRRDL